MDVLSLPLTTVRGTIGLARFGFHVATIPARLTLRAVALVAEQLGQESGPAEHAHPPAPSPSPTSSDRDGGPAPIRPAAATVPARRRRASTPRGGSSDSSNGRGDPGVAREAAPRKARRSAPHKARKTAQPKAGAPTPPGAGEAAPPGAGTPAPPIADTHAPPIADTPAPPTAGAPAPPSVADPPARPDAGREPAAPDAEPPPPHVDEEAVLVLESADPGAADGAGAQVHVEPPWPHYAQMTAADVIERVAVEPEPVLSVLLLYERSHRARRSVIEACERALARLAGPPEPASRS